jgi:hypothetical protein
MLFRCWISLAVLALGSLVEAAPPTLTTLFPAGAGRGSTTLVTATGTFERWPVHAWVEGTGVTVEPGRDKGKLTVKVSAEAEPGVRWLRLFDEQGASAPRPFIIGVLPEVEEQEPNDHFRKPHVLPAAGVTVNGRLDKAGDVDCFSLKLTKGQTLVASLEANHTLRSPMDGVLQVLSSEGFVLAENNDFHGLDPQITFPVPRDGSYVVRLFAFPAQPDASIRLAGGEQYIYRLTLTTAGFLDHAFPLAVARSSPGEVELVGWNIPPAARKRRVDSSPGFGDSDDPVLVHHPELTGTSAVRVEPHPTLTHVEPGNRENPQTVELPVTISGRIERPGAVHVYQFRGRKGQRLDIQIEAASLGFPLEPILRLTDPAGKVLAQAQANKPGTDPALAFVVSQDGAYRIEVRDLFDQGSRRHLYRLRLLEATPDFALTVAADRFTLTPGKPLELAVGVVRRNGFNGPIELSVEGLPEGVTATPLPAGSGATSLNVRLLASPETGPTAGVLRIAGRGKDSKGTLRWARTRVAEFDATTSHLWLTVRGGSGR